MTFLLYGLALLFYPVYLVLAPTKRYVERYADPTTHSAYVINNWSKFPVDPVVGK